MEVSKLLHQISYHRPQRESPLWKLLLGFERSQSLTINCLGRSVCAGSIVAAIATLREPIPAPCGSCLDVGRRSFPSTKLIVPKGFSPIFPDGRVKQKD